MIKRIAAFATASLLTLGCAGATDDEQETGDVAEDLIATQTQALNGSTGAALQQLCERIFEVDHFINVGDGATLHVRESFSGRSLLRFPRRSMLMITPTLVTNELYDADVTPDDTYNAMARAAHQGYFAFAPSYEGYELSSQPAEGKSVTAERSLGQMSNLVKWIRKNRLVKEVDLYGMSLGASLANVLGGVMSPGNPEHIDRVVVAANVYKSFTPEVSAIFSPEFKAFLQSIPGGYFTTDASFYFPVVALADPAAFNWVMANAPGTYSLGPTLEAFDLPIFEASYGRAPLLQAWGTFDPLTPESDVIQFQTEYGGPASLLTIEGGGHSPFLEAGKEQFWAAAFAFWKQGESQSLSVCDIVAGEH
jgi:pimeloyl-ACP methyl ester carboxylesterase